MEHSAKIPNRQPDKKCKKLKALKKRLSGNEKEIVFKTNNSNLLLSGSAGVAKRARFKKRKPSLGHSKKPSGLVPSQVRILSPADHYQKNSKPNKNNC